MYDSAYRKLSHKTFQIYCHYYSFNATQRSRTGTMGKKKFANTTLAPLNVINPLHVPLSQPDTLRIPRLILDDLTVTVFKVHKSYYCFNFFIVVFISLRIQLHICIFWNPFYQRFLNCFWTSKN